MQHHSGLGIASFIISMITGLLTFLAIVFAGVMEATTPGGMDPESAGAIILGFFLIACLCGLLVAIGLGIGGLVQRDRKKLFAVLGVTFSAVILIGTLALMVIGLALD